MPRQRLLGPTAIRHEGEVVLREILHTFKNGCSVNP